VVGTQVVAVERSGAFVEGAPSNDHWGPRAPAPLRHLLRAR
jgi:hypothetical protein